LDAVTGVSGSGPAFVARLVEAFTDAGVAHGLDRDVAYRLVLQTFSGTARLLDEKGLSPQELVDMVSSKGGTTVAGRRVLESSDYADVIRRTVDAAVARSRELGS
ncbi:MAG: pyrroline-5-carboxylate reductase family protein, partial [Spirochaetota bacterium]